MSQMPTIRKGSCRNHDACLQCHIHRIAITCLAIVHPEAHCHTSYFTLYGGKGAEKGFVNGPLQGLLSISAMLYAHAQVA
jgi:hypothetical protein